jgi:hypothetical protein
VSAMPAKLAKGDKTMSVVPDNLRRATAEGGTVSDKLLLSLVEAVEAQTAVQEETLHHELQRIADAQEKIAGLLRELVAAMRGERGAM